MTDDVEEALAEVLARVAGPPDIAIDGAKALFGLREMDGELAALTYDSLVEAASGVRGDGQPRILTFEADGVTVEVELDDRPGARRLIGQLDPPGPAELSVLLGGGAGARGSADDHGRFVLALPATPQRVSLRCVRGDRAVETSWLVV